MVIIRVLGALVLAVLVVLSVQLLPVSVPSKILLGIGLGLGTYGGLLLLIKTLEER